MMRLTYEQTKVEICHKMDQFSDKFKDTNLCDTSVENEVILEVILGCPLDVDKSDRQSLEMRQRKSRPLVYVES